MKRILLSILVIGVLLLSACGTLAVTEQPTQPKPAPAPSAAFTITGFDQSSFYPLEIVNGEMQLSAEKTWSSRVYIYYDIENIGMVYLRYYKLYFTIMFDDGSQYQDWTDGTNIPVGLIGQIWSERGFSDTGSDKKVTSVKITNWELTAGTPPKVLYVITGTTGNEVNITLANASGGTEQYSNVSIPGKYSYSSFTNSFLYISAQNQGESGRVTVSIYVNGNLFKTSTSSGAYVIATASGSK
jgi:hypothetical protein